MSRPTYYVNIKLVFIHKKVIRESKSLKFHDLFSLRHFLPAKFLPVKYVITYKEKELFTVGTQFWVCPMKNWDFGRYNNKRFNEFLDLNETKYTIHKCLQYINIYILNICKHSGLKFEVHTPFSRKTSECESIDP